MERAVHAANMTIYRFREDQTMSEKQISGKELLEYVNLEADSELVNRCRNCGSKVPFDYRTNDDFWLSILMPLDWSRDVLCLPCFTELAGEDVHDNLYVIYYSGDGRTTPFVPAYALAQLEEKKDDAYGECEYLSIQLRRLKKENSALKRENKALRELFIDLLATQGLVTAKREVEIPEELSATLDIGLPLAHRIVDTLLTTEEQK